MPDMKNRNVLITGASRGIGAAVTSLLARQGADLLLVYHRDEKAADALSRDLSDAPGTISWVQADVGTKKGCEDIMAAASERFKGRIDGLVNNAGICVEETFLLIEDVDVEKMIAVNILGTVRLTRAVLRPMILQRSGAIVNLSSIAASIGSRGNAVYAGTKGFIESFTKSTAQEVGKKGVRVNAVAPGVIETDMTKSIRSSAESVMVERIALRRIGKPEEAAAAVAFLLSDRASYLSGAVIAVDGGFA
jgi:3-oxoacyl-[acyl-carrier protein] reductase